jgi:DNA-binding NarL/FixJ family response regulator
LHIGVVIKTNTGIDVIKQLQNTSVLGILLDIHDYTMVEVGKATQALISNTPYWPDHIINRLPHPQKSLPTVVSFWVKPCVTLSNDIKQQVLDKNLYRANFCDSWDRLTACAGNSADLILFHSGMIGTQGLSATEIVNMISTLVHYTSGPPPKIGAVVDKDTPIAIIKELRKTNICGIVPNYTYWGVDVGTSSVVSLLKNESNWPMQHLFSNQAQIDEVMSITPPVKIANIPLTTRQQEIADLIKYRGISNKHIARQLGIGESAVKLHVGAILKKHNLRNRTQLAVALSQGLKA